MIETYPLFQKAADLIKNHYTNGCLLEIGAGSHSTPFFRQLAIENNIIMHSVDKAEFRLSAPTPYQNLIKCHITTGENFLRNIKETIFFCYMDNLDWLNYEELTNPNPFYVGCTKEKSENVHLEQSELLIKKMDPDGFILFDDTGVQLPEEVSPEFIMENINKIKFYGKGAKAVPFLVNAGMKIIGYSANRHHGGFDGEHDQILLRR